MPSTAGNKEPTQSRQSHAVSKMRPPLLSFLLVFLTLQLAAQTIAQSQMSVIEAFEDSSCLERNSDMVPNSITFDASKPTCTLVRDDTTIPIVDEYDVVFYQSAETCAAGIPILVNYSNTNVGPTLWPSTPMPIFPSPFSNRNMTFCLDNLKRYSSDSSTLNRIVKQRVYTSGARTKQGFAGAFGFPFLCSLDPGTDVLGSSGNLNHDIEFRSFVQYPTNRSIKYGFPMFMRNNSDVQYQEFQTCVPDTCCSTGTGPNKIHFQVPGSSVRFQPPVKAYARVLSCSSGNMMFQIFNDDKCTIGSNFPSVLRADGSCQKNPASSSQMGSMIWAQYGYEAYFKGRCQSATGPAPASSVSVSGFLDPQCTVPNHDILPSTIDCDSSQCCLIANQMDVKYLDGAVVNFFASASDCEKFLPMHPLNISIVDAMSWKRVPLTISGFDGPWTPDYSYSSCRLECSNKYGSQPSPLWSQCRPCPLYRLDTRDISFFGLFPRQPFNFHCQQIGNQTHPKFIGYFAQYLGGGNWSFAIRMFSDWLCSNEINTDPTVAPGIMCATDTCCRSGNSASSFYYRIPSSMMEYSSKKENVYGRLLSCNGDVAMFYQFTDSACSKKYSLIPNAIRADGKCAAVPTSRYAIGTFYSATCANPTRQLVQSVSVSAFSDETCQTPFAQPIQQVVCPINSCCLVKQAADPGGDPDYSRKYSAVYARALSCDSQVLLFNMYDDPKCTIARTFTPMALRADNTCQVDQSGYTNFYRASCQMLPAPPPSPLFPCPKDRQGNICGGSEFGTCNAGATFSTCVCVAGKGFFNGQICVSQGAIAETFALVNKTFAHQQQQANILNELFCADLSLPVKCPRADWVASQNWNQCQTSMAACAASAADFRIFLQNSANKCSGSTPVFDPVLMQCIPSGLSRTPALSCPVGMMRCSDGTCAATCSAVQAPACPSGSMGSYLCPGNQLLCAASLSECSKKQPWNGCPINLLQCPNRPGVCVASLQDCATAPGP
jgi:hypothetical protein